MNSFKSGWYLIYTKPRHEKRVSDRLTEININSFLPMRKTLRTWWDRKKYVDAPLFPSYLFTWLNEARDYYDSLSIEGVVCYVKTGRDIARVSDSVINNVRLMVNLDKEIEVCDDHFHAGQKLVISEGALTGLCCEVIKYNGKSKILVRVDLLQRNILLTLPSEHLVPETICQ